MSAAEEQVVEAIEETTEEVNELPEVSEGINITDASNAIAKDLFGSEPKEEPVEEEVTEEVAETEEAVEEETAEEAEEEVEEVEAKDPPQSWKKEMHESWQKLEPEVQEYIELRESQMKEGLSINKEDATLGRTMRDVLAPYDDMLKARGIAPDKAVAKLMHTHGILARGTPEQKKQVLDYFAKTYGITEQENVDPHISQLQNQIAQLQNQLNASQQSSLQEKQAKISTEVEAFASEHPYFDNLADDIAAEIRAGHELEEAYRRAYRASHYYDKDIEKQRKEEEKQAKEAKKKEAEQAKKASSANVRGRDTKKAPTAPKGTMEDTMRETFRKIQSRN